MVSGADPGLCKSKNKQWRLTVVSFMKISPQLHDAFLEDLGTLDSIASDNVDEPVPSYFCSTPIQIVEEDAEDDGYVEFRKRLGMGLNEPVPCCEREKVMWSILCVAVNAVLVHCLREKVSEDSEGCVIDTPVQRHCDWTSEDINGKL